MGESRLTGARNSLWSVAPVVVFKQKCDGTGCVSQSIFLAAAWRKGPREPDEGWRIDKQTIAIVQERGEGSLDKTMALRRER